MGKSATAKSPANGLMKKARLNGQRAKYYIFCSLICIFAAAAVSAQDNLEFLAEQINRGNSEQKRSALFRIRNLETTEAARIAVPALKDTNEIVRATAAASVVFLPPEEAVPVLLPLLHDKKPFVRKETAYALGKTRNVSAVRPLIAIIQNDKIQEVKDSATSALGEIGDSSAIAALVRILQRPPKENEEFMRRAAARSLGEIANNQILQRQIQSNEPSSRLPDSVNTFRANLSKEIPDFQNAVKMLIKVLQQNEADDVKREAAYALGEIGDDSALFILRALLNSEDYYLVKNCQEAIEKIVLSRPNKI
jgi:HEAT repeat protein